jgi:hypothetical protein
MKISEYMEATAAPPNPAAVAAGVGLPVASVEADLQATSFIAAVERARANRLPNAADDPRNFRCGHNFPPEECPYEHCHVRTMAILFDTPRMPAMPRIADAIRALYARQEHRPSLDAVLAVVERAGRMVE